jgi:uncharacterized protein YrrD
MSVLMRASEVIDRPVVTFAGEAVGQVKDIVYAAGGGQVGGFTLNGRGIFAGPLKQSLPWAAVAGLGSAAVMIEDEGRLADRDAVFAASSGAPDGEAGGEVGNVLGSQVLTDAGVDLGKVADVVLQVSYGPGRQADVVGYEIESSAALAGAAKPGKKVLIPLPDTISASGEHLIVPASTRDFVGHDLAGFGAAVLAFRAQLHGQR